MSDGKLFQSRGAAAPQRMFYRWKNFVRIKFGK